VSIIIVETLLFFLDLLNLHNTKNNFSNISVIYLEFVLTVVRNYFFLQLLIKPTKGVYIFLKYLPRRVL